jgi:hypothetical protein
MSPVSSSSENTGGYKVALSLHKSLFHYPLSKFTVVLHNACVWLDVTYSYWYTRGAWQCRTCPRCCGGERMKSMYVVHDRCPWVTQYRREVWSKDPEMFRSQIGDCGNQNRQSSNSNRKGKWLTWATPAPVEYTSDWQVAMVDTIPPSMLAPSSPEYVIRQGWPLQWGIPPSFDACTLWPRIHHMWRCTIATGDTLPPLMHVPSGPKYVIRQGAPLATGDTLPLPFDTCTLW